MWLIYGRPRPVNVDVDRLRRSGVRIRAPRQPPRLRDAGSTNLSAIGDINGDGIDDVAVGAPWYRARSCVFDDQGTGTHCDGRVWISTGRRTLPRRIDVTKPGRRGMTIIANPGPPDPERRRFSHLSSAKPAGDMTATAMTICSCQSTSSIAATSAQWSGDRPARATPGASYSTPGPADSMATLRRSVTSTATVAPTSLRSPIPVTMSDSSIALSLCVVTAGPVSVGFTRNDESMGTCSTATTASHSQPARRSATSTATGSPTWGREDCSFRTARKAWSSSEAPIGES